MGFLDHSSNNIIIDAVLTDVGRKKLADNNGSFKIAYFSLGDDEVDYSIIQKYGRTVGKEKISKNTPVFEAQTHGDLALKYRLLTLPDPTIVRLPYLTISGIGLDTTTNTLSFTRTGNTTRTIDFEESIEGQTKVPDGANDVTFTVFIPDRFLYIPNKPPLQIDPSSRTASYQVQRSSTNSTTNGSKGSFSLSLYQLDDTTFTVYGDGTTITSVIAIVGDQSGIRNEFQFTITK